ncbi:hypothetical protein QBK99_13025 [Corticibacterium sp. UT-5YL-CI-8]|nr:hypothetical protein [Tianweitania sp. UT-5YL-CI-8]
MKTMASSPSGDALERLSAQASYRSHYGSKAPDVSLTPLFNDQIAVIDRAALIPRLAHRGKRLEKSSLRAKKSPAGLRLPG